MKNWIVSMNVLFTLSGISDVELSFPCRTLDDSCQCIDDFGCILILVFEEGVCTALYKHGYFYVLSQIVPEFRTGVVYLFFDERIKLVGKDSVASVVIWEQDGKQMTLIDECTAELPACLCRVGQHIFRIWDISYERLEGIIFQIFGQIIDVLKVKVEGLLAYVFRSVLL